MKAGGRGGKGVEVKDRRGREVPSKRQHIINVSLKNELVPWWEKRVVPVIDREFEGNRSAFIVEAVRAYMDRYQNGVRRI